MALEASRLKNTACVKFLNDPTRSFWESIADVNVVGGPINRDPGW